MSNLSKMTAIWDDLDASYEKLGTGMTKANFLRKLLANGNEDAVKSALGKASIGISEKEDSTKFFSLQRIMLTLIARFHLIPEDIVNLNKTVKGIIKGRVREINFSKFIDNVQLYKTWSPELIDFSESKYGMDVITADEVHIVRSKSAESVVLKTEIDVEMMKNYTGDDAFYLAIKNAIARRKLGKELSLIFVNKETYDSSSDCSGKMITSDGCVAFNGVKVRMFTL